MENPDMLDSLAQRVHTLEERLVPPTETLTFSGEPQAVAALMTALAEAQGAFEQPKKTTHVHVETRKGPYDFDYAPLEEILRATRPALTKAGIAVLQPVSRATRDKWELRTILAGHGAMLTSLVPFSPQYPVYEGETREDPKALGSLITYYRRYTLASLLGVAADDDDDAGAATGDKTEKTAKRPTSSKRAPSSSQPAGERKAEPPPKAPAPKDGPTITRESMQALIDEFNKQGLQGRAKADLCKEVTGIGLHELDEESCQKLLAHLRGGQ